MAFPKPPELYKLYGSAAKAKRKPPDPPPVISGVYTVFGLVYTTELPVEPQPAAPRPRGELQLRGEVGPQWDARKLYPDGDKIDRAAELKKLNRQLLEEYIAVVGMLATDNTANPEAKAALEEKKAHLGHILANMYALLAQYRPHQARQALIASLVEQVKRRNRLADEVDERCRKAREMLITDAALAAAPGPLNLAPLPPLGSNEASSSAPVAEASQKASAQAAAEASTARVQRLMQQLNSLVDSER